MLSRDDLTAIKRHWTEQTMAGRGNNDVFALLEHIDDLEAFRARVLAVARRLRNTRDDSAAAVKDVPGTIAVSKAEFAYQWEVREVLSVLLALAEEAGDG